MRILVVEDERESREGVCAMLQRVSPDSEIFGADGGEAALKLLAEKRMDLIFLDIHMPGMDGLTLLERIREEDEQVNVIMLSAYDQFSYAQRAIQLGAMDFIVKPCTEDNLARVVEKIEGKLGEAVKEDMFFMPVISQWLMHPSAHADMIADRLRLSASQAYVGRMYLLRVYAEDGNILISRQNKAMRWLYRRVKSAVPPEAYVLMLDSEAMFPMVLFSKEACSLDEAQLTDWLREAQWLFGLRICCAMGNYEGDMLANIRKEYTHCKAQMEYAFYMPAPCVISEGMLKVDPKRQMDAKLLEAMKEQLLKGDGEGTYQALEDIRSDVLRPPYMPVQRLMYTMHMEFINLLGNAGVNLSAARRMEFAEQMGAIAQKTWRIDGFFAAYRTLAVELAASVGEVMAGQNQAVIQRCLEYLQENYSDPELTQEMMARQLHFSAGYFGNMFKQTTGESFVYYLNRLRIHEAQKLLTNSYLKVYEIAEKTGFASVNYFIRVFKQYTQMSPNRYRMLYFARSGQS